MTAFGTKLPYRKVNPFVRSCEGFRMTADRDDAAGTGAVVRKPPKNEPAMGGTCVVPHALSYVGLERQCNLEMMARMLLDGDFMFCAAFDFNELRVAKIAHSTTLAR
jgi:hypothetical protein